MNYGPIIDAARETARQLEASINPASLMDTEVKTHLAASWLTFAELLQQAIRESNMRALQDELNHWTTPGGTS